MQRMIDQKMQQVLDITDKDSTNDFLVPGEDDDLLDVKIIIFDLTTLQEHQLYFDSLS